MATGNGLLSVLLLEECLEEDTFGNLPSHTDEREEDEPKEKKKRVHSCWVRDWIARRNTRESNTLFDLRKEILEVSKML